MRNFNNIFYLGKALLPFTFNNGGFALLCTALNSFNAKFLGQSSTNENKLNLKSYSTLIGVPLEKNPLELNDGDYKKLKEATMPDHLRWYKTQVFIDKIGPIGYLEREFFYENGIWRKSFEINNILSYDRYVWDYLNLDYNDYSIYDLIINKVFSQQLINEKVLNNILTNLNPLCSFSFSFIVKLNYGQGFKSIGQHYLVNNTTSAINLMNEFYIDIAKYHLLYDFTADDLIMVRYWSLGIKVKDANFSTKHINEEVIKSNLSNKSTIKARYLNSNFIPLTMKIDVFYGVLISKKGNIFEFEYRDFIIKVKVVKYMKEHIISIYRNKNEFISGALDYGWNNGFIRTILAHDPFVKDIEKMNINNNITLYIEDFKILNMEHEIKNTFLSLKDKEYSRNNKIISLDIECYQDKNNILVPYACAFYDGKIYKSYYLTDYENWHDMIGNMIDDIMILKYAGYTVYAHNFNKFDSAFLFKNINKKYKITAVLPRDSGLLCFSVWNNINNKKFKIKFTDSIALLPFSLASLGESFKVDIVKDVFPYSFVNESNLKYIGDIPEYKYYEQSTDMILKYSDMKTWYNNDWDLKKETLAYLNKDVVSLYQIMIKMDKIIYDNYRINITSKPTIASLALTILRSNFLEANSQLPKTKGKIESAIRSAYYGGRTELFIPTKFNIYSYDFNSLYPAAMLKDLPVGNAVYSLEKDLTKIFGFIHVKVTTPAGMNIPVLPLRVNTKRGEPKLLFPCGSWTGWYFSEEVKLAQQYGYEIEILESYIFERGINVLKDYTLHMAEYKDNTTGAMRNIHKLLLNTPYGRMGMKNIRDGIIIANLEQYEEISKRHDVLDAFPLTDELFFVKYNKTPSRMACDQSGLNYEAELLKYNENDFVENSTAIAAAITSWARIIMYPWIINSAYTDTDSIFVDQKLPNYMLGKSIGKFKQEYGGAIYKALFVGPKFYYLNTINGDVIKTKGISTNVSKLEFLSLIKGESLKIKDNRWLRNLSNESVQILSQDMIISSEFDKRNKLFSLGNWVNTSPLVVNNQREIVILDLILYKAKEIILFNENLSDYCVLNSIGGAVSLIKIKSPVLDVVNVNFESHKIDTQEIVHSSYDISNDSNLCLLPKQLWGDFKWCSRPDLEFKFPSVTGRWLWLDYKINYVRNLYNNIFENDKIILKLYENNWDINIPTHDQDLIDWKWNLIDNFLKLERKIYKYGPSCLKDNELTNVFIYWYSRNIASNLLIELGYNNEWIIRNKTIYEIEVEKFYLDRNYNVEILKNVNYYDYYLLKDSNIKLHKNSRYTLYELIQNYP